MIGSGDTVSCGAETAVGENTFYSLVNKMKTPSTWFQPGEGSGHRVLRRGCPQWLRRHCLLRRPMEQEEDRGSNCCVSGRVGAFRVQLQVAAGLIMVLCGWVLRPALYYQNRTNLGWCAWYKEPQGASVPHSLAILSSFSAVALRIIAV